MVTYDPKDPDDVDDFTLDWSDVLAAGETVSSVTTSVTSGTATVSSSSVSSDGTSTTHRVSGGAADETVEIRVRATLSSGRQLDETMQFEITEN